MRPDFLKASLAKAGLAGLLLAVLNTTIPRALGDTSVPMTRPVLEVTGYVSVFYIDSVAMLGDRSGVVVWLAPIESGQIVRANAEWPHYRMTQRNKMFHPRLLVVLTGSVVEFPNHDPWVHSVFSISRSRPFDLGPYEKGARRVVRFNRPGVSYLFCNIHPEMMAIVVTIGSKYFGVSDRTGRVSIDNVPPGKYSLHVWRENATPQALAALRRAISVGEDQRSLPAISIAVSGRIP
jgi:plastocyanin